ncbi:MAG: PHP domain-containing protein [Candidatus Latescibacterota bacterium]|nr:MAG: PHP domain-containing protein [Candidatus Latescibacterota bacterium]
MRIDLHMHSTFSDGLITPAKLVDMAVEEGLAAISLTDHDCLDGVNEMLAAGRKKNIEILTGVELSSEFKGRDLHILGYGVDPNHPEFQDMLKRFRDTRHKRGLKIIEKLDKLGVSIDAEEVMAKSGKGSLGRPHIAAVLAERGYVSTPVQAFDRYIAEGGPAYVPKYKMTPSEAIKYIRMAGGLAFVAHPGIFLENIDEMYALLEEGFDGVEVYHPKHSSEIEKELTMIAEDYGLLISGGSDYHGFTTRDLPIGALDIPYEILQKIKDRLG